MTSTMSKTQEVIDQLVSSRGASYGPPSENHRRTANLWSAYLASRRVPSKAEQGSDFRPIEPSVRLTPDDGCFLNILQKIARCLSAAGPSKDSLQDIQGFAENLLILNNLE